MAALNQATANNVLDALLGVNSFTATITPIRVRLMTTNGSAGVNGTEVPAGAGYMPGPLAPTVTMRPASGGLSQNSTEVKVVNMPACTVVGVELWDSSLIPVRKFYGALQSPKQLNAGDTFTINVGALTALLS